MRIVVKNLSFYFFVSTLICALIFSPMPGVYSLVMAQTAGKCDEVLTKAEESYNKGRFDDAVKFLQSCLEKPGITEKEKMRAYRLLGLAYIAKDYLDEARTAVRKLLEMVPNYQPDEIQDPPPFKKLVEEVQSEQPPVKKEPKEDELERLMVPVEKEKKSKKWYYIGGGVLAAGAIGAAILLSKSGNGASEGAKDLPIPPDLP